jgi:hypothetical protein
MLTITFPAEEFWDEATEKFLKDPHGDVVLQFEHSLVSLSKWESKFEKAFLGKQEKTAEEVLGYVEAMIVTENYPPNTLERLTQSHVAQINNYIDSKQSATVFGEMPKQRGRNETITSELIYYWMVAFNIPFECQTWHLNRLFALVRICNNKNSKPEKMSKAAIAQRNRELNEQRKAQLGTSG